MAKLTITYTTSVEEDGYDSRTTLERYQADTLNDLAHAFYETIIANGFVAESVAVEKTDGNMVWSNC